MIYSFFFADDSLYGRIFGKPFVPAGGYAALETGFFTTF
jgi:hypothetical protein